MPALLHGLDPLIMGVQERVKAGALALALTFGLGTAAPLLPAHAGERPLLLLFGCASACHLLAINCQPCARPL